MADENRWSERDGARRLDEERYGDYGRPYGARRRDRFEDAADRASYLGEDPRFRTGYDDRSQGFGDYGDRGSGRRNLEDRSFDTRPYGEAVTGERRYGGQTPNVRGADRPEKRDWVDKASDEVQSWFGDPEAERRREWDRVREGQHRGRGPRGYKRSDERIREDVHDKLSDDSWLDASEIEVKVSDSEVTLDGAVANRDDKRRAEDLVERVSGVTHVQNNLRVKAR